MHLYKAVLKNNRERRDSSQLEAGRQYPTQERSETRDHNKAHIRISRAEPLDQGNFGNEQA